MPNKLDISPEERKIRKKQLAAEYYIRRKKHINARAKEYYKENREAVREGNRKWTKKNKNKIKDYWVEFYKDPENRKKASKRAVKYRKKHKERDKEKHKIHHKKFQERHKEERKIALEKYRRENWDEISAKNKIYNSKPENKIRAKAYNKLWRKANQEERRILDAEYYYANKDRHRSRIREYHRKRRQEPQHKIRSILTTRVSSALRRQTAKKLDHTLELCGCSVRELMTHLESKFEEGMNWSNMGRKGWEVDHIIPCISFDLTDPEQQRKCFHWSNQQPLWWYDNNAKGYKSPEEWEEYKKNRNPKRKYTLNPNLMYIPKV